MYYPWPALKHYCFTSSTIEHFQTQWLKSNIFEANWNKGVVFWRSKAKPKRHEKQTLTLPHDALPTREQTATSSKCPSTSIKNERIRQTHQDFSVGTLQRNVRNTALRIRASTTLQGHRSARFKSDHLCCVRVYGPSQFLKIILQIGDALIS